MEMYGDWPKMVGQIQETTVKVVTALLTQSEVLPATMPEVVASADRMGDRLTVQLRLRLAGKWDKTEVLGTFYAPLDWWQHLRMAWFPRWWLRRWPVQYKVVPVMTRHEVWTVCPHLPVRSHDHGQCIQFLTSERDRHEP